MNLNKALSRLTKEEYKLQILKLYNSQSKCCYFCGEEINLDIQNISILHKVRLADRGIDNEVNRALTHEWCKTLRGYKLEKMFSN